MTFFYDKNGNLYEAAKSGKGEATPIEGYRFNRQTGHVEAAVIDNSQSGLSDAIKAAFKSLINKSSLLLPIGNPFMMEMISGKPMKNNGQIVL